MKSIDIKAGQRTRIIHMFSNSIPMTLDFRAEAVRKGQQVSGEVEVRGSNWLFPKPPVVQELGEENSVEKGMWDTFYSVYVTPRNDVRIETRTTGGTQIWVFLIIALVLLAVVSSLFPMLFS